MIMHFKRQWSVYLWYLIIFIGLIITITPKNPTPAATIFILVIFSSKNTPDKSTVRRGKTAINACVNTNPT